MPAARDEALALVLSGGGARGAFDAGVVEAVELLTVLPETPVRGIGDLLDFEPEVARELVASGRSVAHDRLEAAGWS